MTTSSDNIDYIKKRTKRSKLLGLINPVLVLILNTYNKTLLKHRKMILRSCSPAVKYTFSLDTYKYISKTSYIYRLRLAVRFIFNPKIFPYMYKVQFLYNFINLQY